MADDTADDSQRDDPEADFLIALWQQLDPALDLSIEPNALENLPTIEHHLETALQLIRHWRSARR